MFGAMQAVAVRQERRKQEKKRTGRPAKLQIQNDEEGTGSVYNLVVDDSPHDSPRQSPKVRTLSHDSSLPPTPVAVTSPQAVVGAVTSTNSFTSLQIQPSDTSLDFCCRGYFPLLHLIIVSFLVGITLLIVGLVQFKPGAESSERKFSIVGASAGCLLVGFLLLGIRLWKGKKRERRDRAKSDTERTDVAKITGFRGQSEESDKY
ncbi:uncharacterized protein LOC136039525 [Artemia franciscana]|uniref:Uncharacterized protein n=1 Tax=Artemia franciscana TaxID=6661 RepID=A0AA88L565_ARTSF|nr:hypothetical protein QYM36_007392 [Artemia franciscana]